MDLSISGHGQALTPRTAAAAAHSARKAAGSPNVRSAGRADVSAVRYAAAEPHAAPVLQQQPSSLLNVQDLEGTSFSVHEASHEPMAPILGSESVRVGTGTDTEDDLRSKVDVDVLLQETSKSTARRALSGSDSMTPVNAMTASLVSRSPVPRNPWFEQAFHVEPHLPAVLKSPPRQVDEVSRAHEISSGETEVPRPSIWDSPDKVSQREKELIDMLNHLRAQMQNRREDQETQQPLLATSSSSPLVSGRGHSRQHLPQPHDLPLSIPPATATAAEPPAVMDYRALMIKDRRKLSKEERARLRDEVRRPVPVASANAQLDGGGLSANAQQQQQHVAGADDDPADRDALVLRSYESFLELLRRQEKMLSMKRHLIDLEQRRGPKPKWYECKGTDFSYEIKKFNQVESILRASMPTGPTERGLLSPRPAGHTAAASLSLSHALRRPRTADARRAGRGGEALGSHPLSIAGQRVVQQ